jgi:non-canonical (house-cleaning) NTP pyrophosphatase
LSVLFCRLAIMITDLKDFWQRLQTGVEVAVAGPSSDRLLGVRDGLLRYFHDGLDRAVSVVVVPQPIEEPAVGLPVSDEEVLELCRARALQLESSLGQIYHFYIATEAGVHTVELGGRSRYFVRYWTVVRGLLGEAWGSSGSLQLPERIVEGLSHDQIPLSMPGTLRSGGMISSLTGGLETRRKAVAVSTLHALSTLFYGILDSRPIR